MTDIDKELARMQALCDGRRAPIAGSASAHLAEVYSDQLLLLAFCREIVEDIRSRNDSTSQQVKEVRIQAAWDRAEGGD